MQPSEIIGRLLDNLEKVIIGKKETLRLALTCLMARGHLLIEDIPGTGKTMLARAIARSIRGDFHRIQFTADLLPSDITGLSVFNQEKRCFEFRAGPIFSHVVLADEINRGTPRVQSGLLEAMNEYQVTIDGVTHKLPNPFLVIATQNPLSFAGTYPLLTAQLDRFLLQVQMGYLSVEEELAMIKGQWYTHPIETLEPSVSIDEISALQQAVKNVRIDEALIRYILALSQATRTKPGIQYGVSARGTLALFNAVRAYAMVSGRDYIIPDDIKALAGPVLAHRIVYVSQSKDRPKSAHLIQELLESIPVPM